MATLKGYTKFEHSGSPCLEAEKIVTENLIGEKEVMDK